MVLSEKVNDEYKVKKVRDLDDPGQISSEQKKRRH